MDDQGCVPLAGAGGLELDSHLAALAGSSSTRHPSAVKSPLSAPVMSVLELSSGANPVLLIVTWQPTWVPTSAGPQSSVPGGSSSIAGSFCFTTSMYCVACLAYCRAVARSVPEVAVSLCRRCSSSYLNPTADMRTGSRPSRGRRVTSRSRMPGSRAMHSSTRAWLVRKLQLVTPKT